MTVYAPGTEETDPKKQNISLQQNAAANVANATNITTNTANIATNTANITTLQALVPLTSLTNSLGADVLLNNTANYFDGPIVAQGTSGTWFVSGTVSVLDTGGAVNMSFKLWDGTTVIASASATTGAANFAQSVTLSGVIASPASDLRISCRDIGATTGKIVFNRSGNSKDSTITAMRLA